MRLKNINGTSGLTCGCGSWLNHWANFSGQSIPTYCPTFGCMEKKLVGAHVQQDSTTDKKWYIVPLCATHNAKSETLDVGPVALAPANVSETCKKEETYGSLLGSYLTSHPLRR